MSREAMQQARDALKRLLRACDHASVFVGVLPRQDAEQAMTRLDAALRCSWRLRRSKASAPITPATTKTYMTRAVMLQVLEALDAGVSISPGSVLHDRISEALAEEPIGPTSAIGSLGAPVNAAAQCWCHTCRPVTSLRPDEMRMVLCPDCGNKRCPKANDHRNACTGSNKPGQPGSAYP